MPDKLKILQVSKLYYPVIGGVEKTLQQIAEGLKDKIDMKVLVCQRRGAGSVENINGVEVHKAASLGLFFSMPLSFDFFRKFKTLSKNCAILHIHLPFPLADLAVFLFRPKCKIVLWWHSDIVRQKKFLFFYKPFMYWLLNRACTIIVETQGHIEGSDYLPKYKSKCRIIPPAIDDKLLNKGSRYFTSISRKTMKKPERVSVLFVGRLVYYKGCAVLLDAFSQVQNAELTIVGAGNLEKSLQKQAEKLGISKKVHFAGTLSDARLSSVFQNCDIFVLPSVEKTEAFGLVQIEAMAYGKPVINTSLPSGVPYVSLDGVSGLTVPPKDVSALARALQKLIDDDKLRCRLGQGAYRLAHARYTMRQMLAGVMAVYQELQ
ncbi:MAG: glycosyltransferase [Candidatus Margulisbacteria bacterium]|jgi:rhamnosyl/mannosyltransferase|nr:glycosyltransferase [Candidatus Margulisiibacteriota bacterium]